jgi:hypothetical protein
MSDLALLGLVERAEAVLHAQAERLSETNPRLESSESASSRSLTVANRRGCEIQEREEKRLARLLGPLH